MSSLARAARRRSRWRPSRLREGSVVGTSSATRVRDEGWRRESGAGEGRLNPERVENDDRPDPVAQRGRPRGGFFLLEALSL